MLLLGNVKRENWNEQKEEMNEIKKTNDKKNEMAKGE